MASTLPSSRVPTWLPVLGRMGYVAKGVVYGLVGLLAVLAAAGRGGSVGGGKNALVALGHQPFGQVCLAVVALGLFAYTAWRFAQAAVDPAGEGSDGKGLGKRAAYVVNGLTHLALAIFAGSLVWSSTVHAGSGGGSSSSADWTAALMARPAGVWLVGAVGVVVAGYGLWQFQRAYSASFMRHYVGAMDARKRRLARRLGQTGLAARGVVLCVVGALVVQAAIQADPSEARGLGGALSALAAQPYGTWLLGAVALGLIAYGLFCFSYAAYRDFARS